MHTFFPNIFGPARLEKNSSTPDAEHNSEFAPVGAEGREQAMCEMWALGFRKKKKMKSV